MARAIWTGALSFGLVNIPVRLYPATEPKELQFHQFEEGTGRRIRYRRVTDQSDDEVEWSKIVKGYEVRKGHIVTLTQKEVEAAAPEQTRAIEIEQFVELAEIDPIAWDRTYYLGPDKGRPAEKAYTLLLSAMNKKRRVAIGRFVLREKQHLVTVRPFDGLLALETMWFADEIRPTSVVEHKPRSGAVSASDRQLAEKLIDQLTRPWKHEAYRDTHREKLLALIRRKGRGQEIALPEAPEKAGEVIDIQEALKASLARQRGSARAGGSGAKPKARRRASRSRA